MTFYFDDMTSFHFLQNVANASFEEPSPIRTVIAADFDNDGKLEVFFNNIAYHGSAPNRMFKIRPTSDWDVVIEEETELGDATEVNGYGTGKYIILCKVVSFTSPVFFCLFIPSMFFKMTIMLKDTCCRSYTGLPNYTFSCSFIYSSLPSSIIIVPLCCQESVPRRTRVIC